MKVLDFKAKFLQELEPFYDKDEINSMFRLVTEHVIHKTYIDIVLNPELVLKTPDILKFNEILSQLKLQRPIQHILGTTEFLGLLFKVNDDVLVPRQETEELVDLIIKDHSKHKGQLQILDIGTGSGCIAVSLKKFVPSSRVFAMDVSERALNIARQNANENKAEITIIQANALDSYSWQAALNSIRFDIIVSNPPYVRQSEKKEMRINVLEFEPHLALFVPDSDPLMFYKNIKEIASQKLKSSGKLYLEINQYLGPETKDLFKETPFENPMLLKDLNGNDRFVVASMRANNT